MSDVTLKRIIDLETQSEVDSSVYTIVDSPTGMGKKYPIGNLVGEVTDLKQELNQEKKYQLLLDDSVPNTVQEYTFSGGAVSQVTHKRSGTTIRTDAFTYETSSITEVRTLNTGESMTIATNLETLETSVTYTAA